MKNQPSKNAYTFNIDVKEVLTTLISPDFDSCELAPNVWADEQSQS